MTAKAFKTVRPDAKGRITLGSLASGVSSYRITKDKNQRIILEPLIEVPAKEKWLFDNKAASNQVKQGLQDSAHKRIKSRGSFAKYVDDNDTE